MPQNVFNSYVNYNATNIFKIQNTIENQSHVNEDKIGIQVGKILDSMNNYWNNIYKGGKK